jgi:hypothetical protein
MERARAKRRWLQFRLRTLLLAALFASLPMAWIAYQRQLARNRQAAVAELDRLNVLVYQYEPTVLGRTIRPWTSFDQIVRRRLGDDFVSSPSAVNAAHIDDAQVAYLIERLKLFPELRLVHVGWLSKESREQLSRECPGVEFRTVPQFWEALAD